MRVHQSSLLLLGSKTSVTVGPFQFGDGADGDDGSADSVQPKGRWAQRFDQNLAFKSQLDLTQLDDDMGQSCLVLVLFCPFSHCTFWYRLWFFVCTFFCDGVGVGGPMYNQIMPEFLCVCSGLQIPPPYSYCITECIGISDFVCVQLPYYGCSVYLLDILTVCNEIGCSDTLDQ